MENFYKTEYETSQLSIEDLCIKYDITVSDIPNHSSWVKQSAEPLDLDIIVANDIVPDVSSDVAILENVQQFKRMAVKQAKERIATDTMMDTKELKDLVSVVDTIEKSLTGKNDSGTTVNVLVQNIQQRFKDDC